MAHGAHRTDAEILLFLDADLIGLRASQVDEMLAPMLREQSPADMTLGLFGAVRGGPLGWWLSWCHRATPSITGQRAIRRDLFLSTPGLTRSRFGVEAAITKWVQSDPELRVDYVYLHSVTHPIKEEKLGLIRGSRNRMRMYRDIGQTLFADVARQQAALRREKALRWLERLTKIKCGSRSHFLGSWRSWRRSLARRGAASTPTASCCCRAAGWSAARRYSSRSGCSAWRACRRPIPLATWPIILCPGEIHCPRFAGRPPRKCDSYFGARYLSRLASTRSKPRAMARLVKISLARRTRPLLP